MKTAPTARIKPAPGVTIKNKKAFEEIKTSLAPYIEEIHTIRQNLSDISTIPDYPAAAADLVTTARDSVGELYSILCQTIFESDPDLIPEDSSKKKSRKTKQDQVYAPIPDKLPSLPYAFRSLYVCTYNPPEEDKYNPVKTTKPNLLDGRLVFTASDLDTKGFTRRATETAVFEHIEQLFASMFIFASTGDANIFALAPAALIAGLPVFSVTNADNTRIHAYIDLREDIYNRNIVDTIIEMSDRFYDAFLSPYITFRNHNGIYEYIMDKDALLKGENYDEKKARAPVAANIVSIPLDEQLLFQAAFKEIPSYLDNPTNIANLLRNIRHQVVPEYNAIFEMKLEQMSDNKAVLSEMRLSKARKEFSSGRIHEVKHIFNSLVQIAIMKNRFIQSERIIPDKKRTDLIGALQREGDITEGQILSLISPFLSSLASTEESTLYDRLSRFTELINTDDVSLINDLKIIDAAEEFGQVLEQYPKHHISTQGLPQEITYSLSFNNLETLSGIPHVISFRSFIRLAHEMIVGNAITHNPDSALIPITLNFSLKQRSGRIFLKIMYSNQGITIPEATLAQVLDPNINRVSSKHGYGRSLKIIQQLIAIQIGIDDSADNDFFGIENSVQDSTVHVWYLLPIAKKSYNLMEGLLTAE